MYAPVSLAPTTYNCVKIRKTAFEASGGRQMSSSFIIRKEKGRKERENLKRNVAAIWWKTVSVSR